MSGQMDKEAASRIQSANDKSGNDPDFKARAQAAGDKNANAAQGNTGSTGNAGSTNTGGKK